MREIARSGRLVSGMRYVRHTGLYEYEYVTSPYNYIIKVQLSSLAGQKNFVALLSNKYGCVIYSALLEREHCDRHDDVCFSR